MRSWNLRFFSMFMILLLITMEAATPASAYTYGDPNKEEVAEGYELIVSSLSKEPAQFQEAQTAFDQIKEDIRKHMGDKPVAAVQQAIDEQQKEATIQLMQQVLVLNVARRMESVNLEDYPNAKLLLAKGFATYESLSPVIKQKDPGLDETVRGEFNKALEALGNPGLFGVGKKETNPESYEQSKTMILTSLQNFFGMKSLEVGHFNEEGTKQELGASNNQTGEESSGYIWWIIGGVILLLALYGWTKRKR